MGGADRAAAPASGERRERRAPRPTRRPPDRVLVLLIVLACLPVVLAAADLLAGGWTPLGDNATLALRAHDVLGGDPPLVGMPSTSNTIAEQDVAHPGPLEVWLAAVPVAVLGPAGLVATVVAVNVAAIATAVWVGWRRGGRALAVGVTATVLALCWSLGATVVRDPLNSHLQLLVWFAAVLACWDVRLGRWASVPIAVAAGSWVAQAHVVYVPMVLVVGGACAASCWWDQRRRDPEERARAARGRQQGLAAGLVVGVVVSLPMLVDQLTGSGNLGTMADFGDQAGQGLGRAVAVLVTHLGPVPAFLRPGNDPLVLLRQPSTVDLLGFALTCLAVAWALASSRRRDDRTAVTLVHAALWAVAAAVVVVSRTPKGGAVLAADPMLLWKPVTALVWLSVGWAGWRAVAAADARPDLTPAHLRAAAAVGVVAALAVAVAVVGAPLRFGSFGAALEPAATELRDATLGAVAADEPMVQVNASGWAARLYLRHTLVEALERRGTATRVPDDPRVFRRGDDRAPPTATVWVVSGDGALEPPAPGATLVARVELVEGAGASPAARRRLELRRQLDAAGDVVLRPGRVSLEDLRREYFRWTDPGAPDDATLPASWVSVDAYVDLHRNGLVASPVLDDDLVDAVHDDAQGRYFAADEVEAQIWVRDEVP